MRRSPTRARRDEQRPRGARRMQRRTSKDAPTCILDHPSRRALGATASDVGAARHRDLLVARPKKNTAGPPLKGPRNSCRRLLAGLERQQHPRKPCQIKPAKEYSIIFLMRIA